MIGPEQLGRYADAMTTVGLRVAVDGRAGPLQPNRERAVE